MKKKKSDILIVWCRNEFKILISKYPYYWKMNEIYNNKIYFHLKKHTVYWMQKMYSGIWANNKKMEREFRIIVQQDVYPCLSV